MNVSLLQVRAFVAVSRFASFTLAAEALHRTQPAITAQVKQLEQAMGLKLIDRSTRRLRLTATGADLVPVFTRMLQDLDGALDATRQLRSKGGGTIRLACMPSTAASFLPSRIAAFRQRFPKVAFAINDTIGERVIELVKRAEVEFGITDVTPGTADLDVTPLMNDSICAFFLAGHAIERAARVDTEELCRHPLILSAPGTNVRRMVDTAFAAAGRHAFAACEAAYSPSAVGLVRAGLGVALLPPTCVDLELDARLRWRAIEDLGFARQIAIIKLRNRTLSPAAQAFLDELIDASDGAALTGSARQRG